MSILGAVVRVRPFQLPGLLPRIQSLPGMDVALNPGDGRLVLVIEDALQDDGLHRAADTLSLLAAWPEMLSTSLVYEYSGPDTPPLADFDSWRRAPAPASQP